MATGTGFVKAVLSGDTVVLMGQAKGGPPPELQLTLASLQAPRIARGPAQTDEPWAWEAREFLRKLVIGRQVRFKVEYKIESSNRSCGAIFLDDENVCKAVARSGWAPVKGSRYGQSVDFDELNELSAQAQAEKIGVFSESGADKAIRNVQWVAEHGPSLAKKYKGKRVSAIVEQVRDGSSLRVLLPDGFQPSADGSAPAAAEPATPPQPFAAEAKHFTEVRLLNRDVEIEIGGVDSHNNFFGTIHHPAGSIAVEILKNGLARMVDWSLGFAKPAEIPAMRAAEQSAKAAKLRMWKNYAPAPISGQKQFTGRVIEAVSGDTIVVLVSAGSRQEERRVTLASIRAPRMGSIHSEPQPYAVQAKESLRRMCIGKEVDVTIDYVRKPAPGASGRAAEDRRCGTVIARSKSGKTTNVSAQLVREGLAEVVRHRMDEERASTYDELVAAEQAAKDGKKGLHDTNKEPPAHRVVDLSTDPTKAKSYLAFLQRNQSNKAIVEHVFAGGRVKLYVPSENCSTMFALAGMKCPAFGRPATTSASGKARAAREGEPYGQEALDWMRHNTMQREVEVEIETMDRMGTCLGTMYVGKGGARKNVGVQLLEAGFGQTFNADRALRGGELLEAEAGARASRRGVWEHYKEPEADAAEAATPTDEFVPVRVCDISGGGIFFVHAATDLDKLAKIEAELKAMLEEFGTQASPVEPRKGAVVAALFDDGSGKQWFRARVEGREEGAFRVSYIDYGNTDVVPITAMRPLERALQTVPGQARACTLAYLRVPELSADFGRDAGVRLSDLVLDRDMVAKIHFRDPHNRLGVTLFDDSLPTSINEMLVEEGLARTARFSSPAGRRPKNVTHVPPQDKALVDKLIAAQEAAKSARRRMWQYGDMGESDDEL